MWYAVLLPIRKRIVYLDQFAISEMAKVLHPNTKDKVPQFWRDLYGRLDRLVKLQVIVCPTSRFHDTESRMTTEHFEKIRRVNNQLSGGIGFRDEHSIHRTQLLQFAECWLDPTMSIDSIVLNQEKAFLKNPHSWQPQMNVTVNTNYGEEWRANAQKIQVETRAEFKKLLEQRWEMQKTMTAKEFFRRVAIEEGTDYGRTMINLYKERLDKIMTCQSSCSPQKITDCFEILPTPASQLIERLDRFFMAKGFNDKSIDEGFIKTMQYLTDPIQGRIPFNEIAGLLHAAVARKYCAGREECPSEKKISILNDISMISTLLPYCDAMMIDKFCEELMAEPDVKSAVNYNTQIYSYRSREEFLNFLTEIEKKITPDHFEQVRKHYGEGWEAPYYDIFR